MIPNWFQYHKWSRSYNRSFAKITPICCRVNCKWQGAENQQGDRATIEPQTFCYLKEIELKIMKIQRKSQQLVTIT